MPDDSALLPAAINKTAREQPDAPVREETSQRLCSRAERLCTPTLYRYIPPLDLPAIYRTLIANAAKIWACIRKGGCLLQTG